MDHHAFPFTKICTLLLLFVSAVVTPAQSADDLFRQGRALDEKHQNKEALVVLLEADKREPHQAETLRLIAKQYTQLIQEADSNNEKRRLGQQALDFAQEAAGLAPDSAETHLTLAIVYGRVAQNASTRRKVELSKKIHEEAALAAQIDPQLDYAWHILGRWNYELANTHPVLRTLAQALYGKFPQASNDLAVVYFQKAAAINPRNVIHHLELGRAYLALGENAKAKNELQLGLSLPSVEKDDEESKQRARQALRGLD
jgi:tetratricopeptide (TPR) repeat protein